MPQGAAQPAPGEHETSPRPGEPRLRQGRCAAKTRAKRRFVPHAAEGRIRGRRPILRKGGYKP